MSQDSWSKMKAVCIARTRIFYPGPPGVPCEGNRKEKKEKRTEQREEKKRNETKKMILLET